MTIETLGVVVLARDDDCNIEFWTVLGVELCVARSSR